LNDFDIFTLASLYKKTIKKKRDILKFYKISNILKKGIAFFDI